MEEKKLKKEVKETEGKQQKLSYEQLEAYANQTTMQAQKIFQENQALKQTLEELRRNFGLKEVELAIKCLDHAELFSSDFINAVTTKLEEVLMPVEESEEPEDNQDKE